jgi:hypothetical protein
MAAMGSQRARATPATRDHMRDNAQRVSQESISKWPEISTAVAARLTRARLRRVQL